MDKLTLTVKHEVDEDTYRDITYTYYDPQIEDLIEDWSNLLIIMGYHPNTSKQFKKELVDNMDDLLSEEDENN